MCEETRQVRAGGATADFGFLFSFLGRLTIAWPSNPSIFSYLSGNGKQGVVWKGRTAVGKGKAPARPFLGWPEEFGSIFILTMYVNSAKQNLVLIGCSPTLQKAV